MTRTIHPFFAFFPPCIRSVRPSRRRCAPRLRMRQYLSGTKNIPHAEVPAVGGPRNTRAGYPARDNAARTRVLHGTRQIAEAIVVVCLAASPAHALTESEKQDVIRVEAYINSIRTMRTDFTQIAPNGAVAKGTIYISRPGRLRVEYRPPVKLRIFATPQWLIVEDCKVKEPQYLPLRSTPAGILIQESIQLSGDLSVSEVKRQNRWLSVRIVETKATDKGSINLIFQINPFQLTGWTVIDHQGKATQVTFENTQVGTPLDPSLFGYVAKCD